MPANVDQGQGLLCVHFWPGLNRRHMLSVPLFQTNFL